MFETLIFDIKRYAINDGPGIRIVIFLKGCMLNCTWCHNPEGIKTQSELMYSQVKCIQCGTCVTVCAQKALMLDHDGIVIEKVRCNLCGRCTDVCPAKAIELSGKVQAIAEIM